MKQYRLENWKTEIDATNVLVRMDSLLTEKQVEANAQLISAAPDMYEALRHLTGLVDALNAEGYYNTDFAHSALAKAEAIPDKNNKERKRKV